MKKILLRLSSSRIGGNNLRCWYSFRSMSGGFALCFFHLSIKKSLHKRIKAFRGGTKTIRLPIFDNVNRLFLNQNFWWCWFRFRRCFWSRYGVVLVICGGVVLVMSGWLWGVLGFLLFLGCFLCFFRSFLLFLAIPCDFLWFSVPTKIEYLCQLWRHLEVLELVRLRLFYEKPI